jgi:tyrosyl-tRNA synthetase
MTYNFETLKEAILFNTQEVLPTNPVQLDTEIRVLVENANKSRQPIRHYIGFEISGRVHLAGIMTGLKIKKLQEAGVVCSLFLADYHSWINNKLDGKLETIRQVARDYFIPMMLQNCLAVGCDISKIDIVFAKDEYKKEPRNQDFFTWDLQISRQLTLSRVLKSMSVTGKTAGENVNFGSLRYPPMQVCDAFFMQTHLVHSGMDQRKCHVLMREVAPKLDDDFALTIGEARITPIAMHHHLLLGLAKPVLGEVSKMKDEIVEENKMSKSKPDTCIFGDDTEEDITKKIKKAYCPMPNLETQTTEEIILEQKLNPILDWLNYMIFPANREFVITTREQKTTVYGSYSQLEKDYFNGQIHPSDLKSSLTTALVKLLEKPRTWAQNNPQAIEFITKLRK